MWWIRKRAKTIIPVLLLVAVACGGVLIFLGNSPSDGTEQGGSATANSSGTNSGEGAPDGGGVRVYKDENGRIVVSNGSSIKREVSLELPQNCTETLEKIESHIAEFKTAIDADDNSRITMVIYQRLAQDLCSWREYNSMAAKQLSDWFSPQADGSGAGAPTSIDTTTPTSSPAEPSSPTTTTG
jgi:hypothetical protein